VKVDKLKQSQWKDSSYLILLSGLVLLLGGYMLMRYGGWWGEVDTASFTKFISAMIHSRSLVPEGTTYYNGYGYQVLITWLVAFTGLPLGVVQLVGGSLLVIWVVVPAWLAYREFTQSALAASLASLVLFIQPELLFPLLRGTHEKFTRGLMFIGLYLLLRGLRSTTLRVMGMVIVSFYLCGYALISFNNFLASSFILGIMLTLGFMWVSQKLIYKGNVTYTVVVSKLTYVVTSLLVVVFIFTFYAFKPAQYQLRILKYFADRVALLTMNFEAAASNPYQVVNTGWVNPPVYYLISLANWLLLGLSMALWLNQTYRWFIKRSHAPSQYEILLWSFYTAFGLLGAGSILLDVSGALSSNLQLRIFSSFVMIAAPIVGMWLAEKSLSKKSSGKHVWISASLVMGCLMILSVLKATNEPLLSNYWLFYTPSELQSVIWAEQNLSQRSLLTGKTGRINEGYTLRENGRQLDIILYGWGQSSGVDNYLDSRVERLFTERIGGQLHYQYDSLLTYDNGTAQIYHRRPVTPYQK
jgi:hypothetical protein